MSKLQIPAVLKARIANSEKPYVLPKSYNHVWALELQKLIDKKVVKQIGKGVVLTKKSK